MILIVSSTEAVSLKIDPSVVLATRKYVDDKVIEVKAYTDKAMAEHLAAADAHPQYAKKANVPDFLDNLEKIAKAINNDKSFYETIISRISARQPLNNVLTALARLDGNAGNSKGHIPYFSGEYEFNTTEITDFMLAFLAADSANGARVKMGLGNASVRDVGTGNNQIPDMSSFVFSSERQGFKKDPSGFIEQWFTVTVPKAESLVDNGLVDALYPIPFPKRCFGVSVSFLGVTAVSEGNPFVSGMPLDNSTCRIASTYINSGLEVFVRAVGD